MAQEIELDITGYDGGKVPHRFFTQDQETRHLAVIFPGKAYGADLPFLLYPARLLLEKGADLLIIDYTEYTATATSNDDMYIRLKADVNPALDTALARRPYTDITFLGKSLGTMVMGDLLEGNERFHGARCIWMTPLLLSERLRSQIAGAPHRALFIGGTADPQFDPDGLAEMERATGGERITIEGAHHGMEIPGDVLGTLRGLQEVVGGIARFIG